MKWVLCFLLAPFVFVGEWLNERAADGLAEALSFCPDCGHKLATRYNWSCERPHCHCEYHGRSEFRGARGKMPEARA